MDNRKIGWKNVGIITHGMSRNRFYRIFFGIKQRCNNRNNRHYKNYGARGIKCEWNNFDEFKHDMYDYYLKHVNEFGEKQTTIDRINNDGNYCINNCRWATRKIQNNNKRQKTGKKIFVNGRYLTLNELSNIYRIHRTTLSARIFKHNWDIDKAINTPCFLYKRNSKAK